MTNSPLNNESNKFDIPDDFFSNDFARLFNVNLVGQVLITLSWRETCWLISIEFKHNRNCYYASIPFEPDENGYKESRKTFNYFTDENVKKNVMNIIENINQEAQASSDAAAKPRFDSVNRKLH